MEKKKQNTLLALIVLIIIIAVVATVMGLQTNSDIVLNDGTVIPDNVCEERGIKDTVVVFHSNGCPACAIAVPRLEQLEKELDYEFEFINIAVRQDKVVELGLVPTKIPTVVIKCKAYVGAKSTEEYRSLIMG